MPSTLPSLCETRALTELLLLRRWLSASEELLVWPMNTLRGRTRVPSGNVS
ncbi:hypothetical protein D3C81_2117270 [compost metagenome]